MLLLIDNFDSFTYNLVQYFGILGSEVCVVRNDEKSVDQLLALAPTRIVISPGPGTPDDAGISKALIQAAAGKIPILGVCLGHQCICEVFGGRTIRASRPIHGKTSTIHHHDSGIFYGLPHPFTATRYHSLVADKESLPECLEITAETREGEIMGLKHKKFPIEGVQFHPESILTPSGLQLLGNFIKPSSSHVAFSSTTHKLESFQTTDRYSALE